MIGFGQFRWHIDETIIPNNDSIRYLKHTMEPITGIVYEYDPHQWGNGERKLNIDKQYDYVDGKKCGKAYEVYGNIVKEYYRCNNKYYGTTTIWETKRGRYINLNKGEYYILTAENPKGRIESIRNYNQEGLFHGVSKQWYKLHSFSADFQLTEKLPLMIKEYYHKGKRHGLYQYWNKEGQLLKEINYIHGEVVE